MAFFLLLFIVGAVGFHIIEKMSWVNSFYMTVITLSTVGFGEVQTLTPAGRIFTSVLIIFGVSTLAYAATKVTEAIVESGLLRRRRMAMEIKHQHDHVVVCGYGRMGRAVADQLAAQGAACVVIEKNPALVASLDARGVLYVAGDATEDAILSAAGVERAKALATVLPHDADNLFVTVTARRLNRNLVIVSRASSEKNSPKLISAGADRVFNPYESGGRLLARRLLQPSAMEFVEIISGAGQAELAVGEVELAAGSPLVGVALRDGPIKREMDIVVVGVRRQGQDLRFNPPPDLAPQVGDVLVALGRQENLQRLATIAGPSREHR